MPKILSVMMRFLLIFNVFFLFSCGQKGALYLGEAEQDHSDEAIFMPQTDNDIIPSFLQLQPLHIGGTLAHINHRHLPSWQALLTVTDSSTNLIRYVVFDGDVLGESTPLAVLVGSVQNQNVRAPAQRQLAAGNYLRFRSLETGVNHLPGLLASAERYLAKHPTFKRAKGPDFLTEQQQNIDLYLAVEKR